MKNKSTKEQKAENYYQFSILLNNKVSSKGCKDQEAV